MKFRVGFTDLLGRNAFIPEANLDALANFMLQVTYPPNPNRPLDNVLKPDQEAGRLLFSSQKCVIPACVGPGCGPQPCSACHITDPNGNPGTAAPGFFGTIGLSSFAFGPQLIKVPQFRNLYQKVGMFGNPEVPGFVLFDNGFQGDQVRGFGFLHEGYVDTAFRFHHALSFSELTIGTGSGGFPETPAGEVMRRQVEAFVLAFPTNLAPVVGQQITLSGSSSAAVVSRVGLLRQRADAGECELVAKTELLFSEVGFVYVGSGNFRSDRQLLPPIPDAALQLVATYLDLPVTYTCVPLGSGTRIGVDRDGDGFWDGDERDAHSDPADPSSTP
jgi:hypothetical protein